MNETATNTTETGGQVHPMVMPAFEYLLNFWGEVENDNLIEKELGISEKKDLNASNH